MSDLTTLANVKAWLNLTGLAVASISKASSAVVTLQNRPATPLLSGVAYEIEGITGMTQLAAGAYVITVLTPTTFSIPVDSSAFSDYTGGAVVGVTDALLSRLITACSKFIESWLNRTIASVAYTETHNGNGGQTLILNNYPVTQVASVTVDGIVIPPRPPLGAGSSGVYTFNGSPGGWINDDQSVMIAGGCFPRGFQNVTVVYAAGYVFTPPDIEQAAIDMIGDWFRYIDRIGKKSQAIENQSTQFVDVAIPSRALGILQQYKRVTPGFQ